MSRLLIGAKQVLMPDELPFSGTPTIFGHMFLVFEDDSGTKTEVTSLTGTTKDYLESWPVRWQITQVAEPFATASESIAHDATTARVVEQEVFNPIELNGRNATDVWNIINQTAKDIQHRDHLLPYLPLPSDSGEDLGPYHYPVTQGLNSNTFVASLLHTVGIDINQVLPQDHILPLIYPGAQSVLGVSVTLPGGDLGEGYSIDGTNGDDTIIGTYLSDFFTGNGGNDRLVGGAAGDELAGGEGNDTLIGGSRDDSGYQLLDILDGGPGFDIASYEGSVEPVTVRLDPIFSSDDPASFGNKISLAASFTGDANDDFLINMEGIFGSAGDDTITGDNSRNELRGGSGRDTLAGQDGDDLLVGDAGDDQVFGGEGGDTLLGDEELSGPFSVGGSDFLAGNNGPDTLRGGLAKDSLFGGEGNDSLYGGDDSDLLAGDSGNDNLLGNAGADELQGGTGNDILFGGRNEFGTITSGDFDGAVDLFRYFISVGDSGNDLVVDFEDGIDRLVVDGLDGRLTFDSLKSFITIADADVLGVTRPSAIIDIGAAEATIRGSGSPLGTDTITVAGITSIDADDIEFFTNPPDFF